MILFLPFLLLEERQELFYYDWFKVFENLREYTCIFPDFETFLYKIPLGYAYFFPKMNEIFFENPGGLTSLKSSENNFQKIRLNI